MYNTLLWIVVTLLQVNRLFCISSFLWTFTITKLNVSIKQLRSINIIIKYENVYLNYGVLIDFSTFLGHLL